MIYTFFLQDLYTTTEIDEPKGWKDLMSELDRQFDTHGVFFSYAGGGDKAGTVFKLGFACDGKTLLEAEYQENGTEGFYQFGVNKAANEFVTPTNIFLGDIDFESRKFDEEYFNAEINQITNLVKLKNRSKQKINLNIGTDLDGNEIGLMNFDNSIRSLATKDFHQMNVRASAETLDTAQSTAGSGSSSMICQFGTDQKTNIEIKTHKNTRNLTDLSESDIFLTLDEDAALDFDFTFDFDLALTEDQGSGTTTYDITLTMETDKPGFNDQLGNISSFPIFNTSNVAASPNSPTISPNTTGGANAVFESGTNFRMNLLIEMTSTGTSQFSLDFTITTFIIEVIDNVSKDGTISRWYHIHDALNKNLHAMIGNYDYLFSELLGDTLRGYDSVGCMGDMFITNGFRLRQINDDLKAPAFSFSDFINNVNVMGAVGYGIEELESPARIGLFDLFWVEIASDIAEARVLEFNGVYDLVAGTKISFYNSTNIYGTYVLSEVTYNAGGNYTTIKFDVSANTNYFGNLFGDFPVKNNTYPDVFITCDASTEFRDRLRVEHWTHFYNDTQLINLGVVQGYSEEPFNESLINGIQIGFKKYANDENKATTLEDFHTTSSWSIPITKINETLNLINSWIGSTFLLNESRNLVVTQKPTTSHKLDNDIFFCDKALKEGFFVVDFTHLVTPTVRDFITVPANCYENYIKGAVFFVVSGAVDAGNNKTWQIDVSEDVIFDVDANEYQIPLTSQPDDEANDRVFISINFITQKIYKPESDDNLSDTTGITSPNYRYNQRRTIKRFLLRWGQYIKSTLAYLVDATNIKITNTEFANNGEYGNAIDPYFTDCSSDDNLSIIENEEILTDDLGTVKFKPNLIHCTIKICDDDYDMIIAAHKNRLQSPDDIKNYGYFSVTSPLGVSKSGWLMNMKRSPINRIAKLKLLERFTA